MIGKLFKWAAFSILALLALAAAASAVVIALGITFNLDRIRPTVETAVSTALDRKTRITGSVSLTPTLRPTLEIQGLQIDNPEGWTDTVFAAVDLARVQVGLPALLKKQIDVGEITCEKVTLNLETNKKGMNNWEFESKAENVPEPEKETSTEQTRIGLQALDTLSLQQINVRYRDNNLDKILTFGLDDLSGTARQGNPLKLTGKGSVQDKRYDFTIDGGPLEDFRPRQRLYPLSITGTIVDSPFTAKGTLGKDKDEPLLDLDATLGKVDVGALLSWLQLAEGIEAETEELALQLKLRGDNLHKLVTQSNLSFSVKGGHWNVRGAGKGEGIPIAINKGEVSALSGKPVALALNGMIDTTPITINIHGMELINYVAKPKRLPITITIEVAETHLDFHGELALPVSNKDITLAMTLKGEKLNSLDELLKLDLPPIGPYAVEAQFAMGETDYDLSDLKIKIGTSDLKGNLRLDMAGAIPDAEVQLTSNQLQIDDFIFADWSPQGKATSEEEKAEKKTVTDDREKAAGLLSQEALSRANAQLAVALNKVLSGKDTLGSGKLDVSLKDGRFDINPLELKLADGTARTEFSYYPTRETAEIHLESTIDRLDLGILARRAKPETKMGGRLSLDILLDATAPELDQLMANGRGHFDFAFVPENFDAGIIDLWAVNLLSSVASEVDGEPSSIINCLVASFAMEDGLMQERTIFMDTTHMSIEGQASIDFKKQRLKIMAAPKAKKPEFFSLATPVKVSGNFDDFGIDINMVHLTSTVASFLTSPVHVPLRRIFAGKKPADGKEACQMAWENRNLEE